MARQGMLALLLILTPSVAMAQTRAGRGGSQSLTLRTREYGAWPNTVAALQADRSSEGRVVHVVVLDDMGRQAPCGSYELELDAAGARAFRVLSCDPRDDTTAVRLVSRTSLFSHGGPFSRPRSVLLTATEIRTGSTAGGAALTGGAALACSVRVRPYIDDLEHGGHVYLTPDRYFVRVQAAGVNVASGSSGWVLQSGQRAHLDISYDVVDRSTGEVVLSDEATLSCSSRGGAQPSARRSSSAGPRRVGPSPASVSTVRGAAEVNGVGLPLSDFSDELPQDSTVEQPSAFVRSRVERPAPDVSRSWRIPIVDWPRVGSLWTQIGTLDVVAGSDREARRRLRWAAVRAGADALAQVRMTPIRGGVRATALAIRFND